MWFKLVKERFCFETLTNRLKKIYEESFQQKNKYFQQIRSIEIEKLSLEKEKLENLFEEI